MRFSFALLLAALNEVHAYCTASEASTAHLPPVVVTEDGRGALLAEGVSPVPIGLCLLR